ncbi:Glucan endo-1,3-beta-glucosidase-like protein 1-like [Quillaja saponaria]|uniref:Glucan endo-1,3-beta-glucosidase-like protein 1-like n=1 Tax=Quillaja saponaria TaxID=32244 RepID=A0AAD7KYQ3_QUISA|nr:Glucan endo-1,3-beta-glucosidase-like protein 1-like [Quillaja saponaria]
MGKNFSFSVYLSLTLLTLFPFSLASIRRTSKAQNGGVPSVELWCVAKNNAEDAALQSALDWACGAGGSDCSPIQQGGPCYYPSDIQSTASYAFNDYFLKHGSSDDSCKFDNTAALTSLNPSRDKCRFPSSLTVSNGRFIGSSTSVGFGPSKGIGGCSQIAWGWFWPLIITVLTIISG